MSHEALKRALAKADGNQSAFAAAVGTSQQRISYLLAKKKPLPAELVLKTEEAYGIPRHELRPDIYPDPTRAVA
jgi:DNA-binding transcriptional regulator YdaS (Cro superfamily)